MSTTKKEVIWEENKNTILPKNNELPSMNDVCDTIGNINNLNKPAHLTDITKTKISGIYKIVNKINGKYYVGSAQNFKQRWRKHKELLNRNVHPNIHLQRSWNKHGESNFEFIILEYVESENNLLIEQKYLNICKQIHNSTYNISYDATRPMYGRKHSIKTKNKMSNDRRGCKHPLFGKHHSKETREKIKISNSRTYDQIYGKEEADKRKINQSNMWSGNNNPMYGKHHSNETREKIAKSLRGKSASEDTKKKLSLIRRDKTIYTLINDGLNKIFTGTKQDFIRIHNKGIKTIYIYRVINGTHKSYNGWKLPSK